jgi:hypothetical protein
MNWSLFFNYYLIFLLPVFINLLLDFIGYIKHHSKKKVYVSKILRTICYIGAFFALFTFLSNLIDYVIGNDWFLLMMFICYLTLNIIFVILRDEKIVYNETNGDVICFVNFKHYKFQIQEVTRIYYSDEFLDIYLGDKRIRYRNDFLCKIDDFIAFVKQNSKAYYG